MEIRIKFAKYDTMKFISHLEVMRYFQKAIRRSGLDVAYTEGFNPHQIMSFAAPLGVGQTSESEYFDIELSEEINMEEAVVHLNQVMVEGIDVVNMVPISDDKKQTGMSIVAAADYLSSIKTGSFPENWKEQVSSFIDQPTIMVVKKTKKSEKEVDIKPMIYQLEVRDDSVYMQVATGSVENLKPELVMQALCSYLDVDKDSVTFAHHRLEVYANAGTEEDKKFVSLDQVS
jgi:radical SAM-linked protein